MIIELHNTFVFEKIWDLVTMTHQKNEKSLFRVIEENYDTLFCSQKI